MKKIKKVLLLFIILTLSISLCSCDFSNFSINLNNDTSNASYIVTLIKNNGEEDETLEVASNEVLEKPIDPKKNNFIFEGWYLDNEFTNPYSFTSPVTSSFSLYAKFIVDSQTITNLISTNYIKATGSVTKYDYNISILNSSTNSGSAVIFYEDDNYYYALTNCHVTYKDSSYKKHHYEFYDYLGNDYDANVYVENASYDLAIVFFKKGTEELLVISRAEANPIVNDYIEAIGNPNGQSNTITLGNISSVSSKITLDCSTEESNVTFNVLKHNCYIDHGSSGGALLNTDFLLVGINFAGAVDTDGNFVAGYAIPILKVNEFLNEYFFAN